MAEGVGVLSSSVSEVIKDAGKSENLEDAAVGHSSKAVFLALNPTKKDKIHGDEVLEHIKNVQDGGGTAIGFSHAAKLALSSVYVKKAIHKVIRAKDCKSLSESDMVALNKRFISGHLPRIRKDSNICFSDGEKVSDNEETRDTDDSQRAERGMFKDLMKRGYRYSLKSALFMKNYLEKVISKRGTSWLMSLIPTGQISTLLTFTLFTYVIRASFLSWFIPLTTLAFSLGIMVVSTMRLARGAKRFAEFKAWSEFLDAVGDTQPVTIDTAKAEETYILNHVAPYIQFLISGIFCVMSFGVMDAGWVFNAELGMLSLLMYVTTLYIYDMHKNIRSWSIVLLQIFATLLEGFHRMDDGKPFGQLFSVAVPFVGVDINVGVSVCLRIGVLINIVRSMQRKSYKTLAVRLVNQALPHLVAAFWWEIAVMFLRMCSLSSIMRAAVECVSLLFAMPALFVFVVLVILKFLLSLEITKLLGMVLLLALPVIYFKAGTHKDTFLATLSKHICVERIKPILTMLGVIILAGLMFYYRPSGLMVPKSDLTWAEYQSICFNQEQKSVAVDVACNEFRGYGIHWQGNVKSIAVSEITNEMERFLNVVPHSVAIFLSCVYGSVFPTPEECSLTDGTNSSLEKASCRIAPHARRPCHLLNYNSYTFQIDVAMTPSPGGENALSLKVGHDFSEVIFELEEDSSIQFLGTIESRSLVSVKALFTKGEDNALKRHSRRRKKIENTLSDMLDGATNALFRFVLYPGITFIEEPEEE